MSKHATRCICVLMILMISFNLFSCSNSTIKANARPNPSILLQNQKSIIHGCGRIQTKQGSFNTTNSLEAFEYWYEKGYRIFEFDFNFTTDGELACVHDWGRASTDKSPLSMNAFMNSKIHGSLTPMNLDAVAQKLQNDSGLFVVTDIKTDNIEGIQKIAERFPELRDQFIIQIYNYQEYETVKNAGFKHILLTIYAMGSNEEKLNADKIAEFSKNNNLFAITFPYELCSIDGYVEKLSESGIPLLIHTVNESDEQMRYIDMGIDGIYADTPPALSDNV